MFIVLAAIYLAFLTKNYYWDGIAFAQAIEGAPKLNASLVHPNHLIYNLVGYIFYRAAQALGFNPRAVTVLQILNAVLGAATCGCYFTFSRTYCGSTYYAVTPESAFRFFRDLVEIHYSMPMLTSRASCLLLLSFYLVLPGRKSNQSSSL